MVANKTKSGASRAGLTEDVPLVARDNNSASTSSGERSAAVMR
jgi:hypothetical protein